MKRKREVFGNYDDLIAAWVDGTQETGRTSKVRIGGAWGSDSRPPSIGVRLTFKGDTLLSYGHFPVARRVSPTVAFVTTRYWTTTVLKSPTTEKHKREARRQLQRDNVRTFALADITSEDRAAQLDSLKAQYVEAVERWKHARFPGNFSHWRAQASVNLSEVEAFAKTFGLTYDRRWVLPVLAPVVKAKVATFKKILVHRTLQRMGVAA